MRPELMQRDEKVWRGLHWLLTLSLPFLILALLSCRRAEEQPEDLGPQVDGKAVQSVLDEATKGNTYANGQKDQYVYYEENISAQGGVYQDRGSSLVYVKDRTESGNNVNFAMYYERRELDENGNFQTVKSDGNYSWDKDKVTGVEDTSDSDAPTFNAVMKQMKQMKIHSVVKTLGRPEEPIKETYHRFEVQRGDIYPVPEAVKSRPDCGGLAGCKYDALFIKLDQVRWYSETDYDKFHYDLIYNKTTPFLFNLKNDTMGGLLVLGCISTYVPYDGRKVYVRDCIQLKDFQK